VGIHENILIVEDEEEWRGIYERAVGAQGSPQTIKIATDLAGAKRLIDAARFAVAFVDIGLDITDDGNVDGVQVMERIRATDPDTSIVVVTGRSGQDVLQITRDAIKKYGAYDTVGKSTVRPADIRRLLEGGLEAYRSAAAPSRLAARDALSGDANPNIWDDRVTRAIGYRGDTGAFYGFLTKLFSEYLPIVPRRDGDRTIVDQERKLVYGGYWSRAIAAAIAICVGASDGFDDAVKGALRALGNDGAAQVIGELEGPGIQGRVYLLAGQDRGSFADR
jgi:CheY-like chemotaxis protein